MFESLLDRNAHPWRNSFFSTNCKTVSPPLINLSVLFNSPIKSCYSEQEMEELALAFSQLPFHDSSPRCSFTDDVHDRHSITSVRSTTKKFLSKIAGHIRCLTRKNMIKPFFQPVAGPWSVSTLAEGQTKYLDEAEMPYYYGTLSPKDSVTVVILFVFIAFAFGAIHCAAWSFAFPTKAEQYIWRTSALLTTILPACGFVYYCVIKVYVFSLQRGSRFTDPARLFWFSIVRSRIFFHISCSIPVLYIIARVVLLVQMLVLLRSSPIDVHSSIEWTDWIPHV
jgi:hypothetical protein